MFDETDIKILTIIQSEGRISNVKLSKRVQLSSPAVHSRIKRMEKMGAINHYATILDRGTFDFELLCFISVSIRLHQKKEMASFKSIILNMPEVLECYNVTGEYDYLLKVVLKNRVDLQNIIEKITSIPGVSKLYTRLAIDEIKNTTILPIES